MAKKTFNPGTKDHPSGQFKQPGKKTEITSVSGKPLPPTDKTGKKWELVDKTKHKNN